MYMYVDLSVTETALHGTNVSDPLTGSAKTKYDLLVILLPYLEENRKNVTLTG